MGVTVLGIQHISIHALLAESDGGSGVGSWPRGIFLSTLSLRRATAIYPSSTPPKKYFYPRSPCGERPPRGGSCYLDNIISIHALLAESDVHYDNYNLHCVEISIHALLAESDEFRKLLYPGSTNFYPRSPCGERRVHYDNYNLHCVISIHALLAESDSAPRITPTASRNFYPRSPCGERRYWFGVPVVGRSISIHALLAESDAPPYNLMIHQKNFYPRSPCGERPALAVLLMFSLYFYPRSPCGERPTKSGQGASNQPISIHALLAESDVKFSVSGSVK